MSSLTKKLDILDVFDLDPPPSVSQSIIPPQSEEELKLVEQQIILSQQQIDSLRSQSIFQQDFFQRLQSQLPGEEQLAQFTQQGLDLESRRLDLQQQQIEQAAEQGTLTKELFQSQVDALGALKQQIEAQPQFSPQAQEAFNQQQLQIQERLADLQQQEVQQSIDRSAQENKFFAAQLRAIETAGEVTPEQEELIQNAITGARERGISSIELNRDLSLEQLELAKNSRLSGLDSDVAAAISGINADVFDRVSRIERDSGVALEDIDRLSTDALEQVRDILAPSRGLRPTDTPITDRGFEIAGEATRARGDVIGGAVRTTQDILQRAGGQIGDIEAQSLRARTDIGQESEILRAGRVSEADQLLAQLEGGLSEAEATAKLNFPLAVSQFQSAAGATGAGLISQDQQFQQQLSQLQEQQRLNFPITSAQVSSGIAGQAIDANQATQQFQAQLAQNAFTNRLNLTNTAGVLGLGISEISPNAAGTLASLTQSRVAGATTIGTGPNPGAGADALGGIGGLLSGIANISSCWVARLVYGDNPDWMKFRHFVLNKAPRWFQDLYLANGEYIADAIKDDLEIQREIRQLMDEIIHG